LRMTEIVRVDAKGRIIIPIPIREALRFREGMYLMLTGDLDSKEVIITPFADPEAKLMEFRVGIKDVPGALARVAGVLADANVDLLSSESRTLRRGEAAEWLAIADVSKCACEMEALRKRVLKEGAAKSVEIREHLRI